MAEEATGPAVAGEPLRWRLSPQQRQLWTRAQEGGGYVAQCALALSGAFHPERLRAAVDAVVGRHEILRTTFPRRSGFRFPFQEVGTGKDFEWRQADFPAAAPGGLDQRMRQERERPFDFGGGALRAALAADEEGKPFLVLTLSALHADVKSLVNLALEIGSAYAASGAGSVLEEEPVQYRAFSEWQNELLEAEEESAAGAAYWRSLRLGAPVSIESDDLGPWEPSGTLPEQVDLLVETSTVEELQALARESGSSLELLLLAAWQALLARLSRNPEPAVGYAGQGRGHEDLVGIVGPLARYVPVAGSFSGDLPMASALERVAQAVDDAIGWQEYWSEEASGRRAPSIGFDFQEWPDVIAAADLSLSVARQHTCLDRFSLRLSAWHRRSGPLHLGLFYDPSILSAEAARRLAVRLRLLLLGIAEAPARPLDQIDVLEPEELRRRLIDFNSTARAWRREATVHQLFEEQAARTPARTAVRHGAVDLTYAELDRRADELASRLRRLGVGPESPVGVYCDRSPEMVVAVLGILKAGGAFLPLDPSHPQERLAWTLDDARPRVLLTERHLVATLPDTKTAQVLTLPLDPGAADSEEEARAAEFAPGALAENLAYVIYTSGSTGRPKGVSVPHRGLVHYLSWCMTAYRPAEGEMTPLHSPLGFDLTFTSLFVPLISGGTVLLVPEGPGVAALASVLTGDLGLVKLTPSHLEVLARSESVGPTGRVGAFVIGGEALRGETLAEWRRLRPEARLINEYGPTETVVGCAFFEAPKEDPGPGPVPIGKPIDNLRIYVLDRHFRLVPGGVPGEIFVGGPGVARGYLNRPDLTAEKMLPDPFGTEPGGRLYRTGDLARHLPDGNLAFLGRYDQQVKIRGHRIEPGEIEAALLRFPGVREAAVLARPEPTGELRLVAYLGSAPGARVTSGEVRAFLAGRLPEAMIPSFFVPLAALPLTANGKVDRAALPDPAGVVREDLEASYVAPRNETERALSEIWAEVLGVERVGIEDGFFALGGDSIRSVRAVAQGRKAGLEFSVQDLFQHQTIAKLAEFLGGGAAVPESEDEELARLLDELEALSDQEALDRARGQAGEEGTL